MLVQLWLSAPPPPPERSASLRPPVAGQLESCCRVGAARPRVAQPATRAAFCPTH